MYISIHISEMNDNEEAIELINHLDINRNRNRNTERLISIIHKISVISLIVLILVALPMLIYGASNRHI